MAHKGLFNWLWENAKKQCPELSPNIAERYPSFTLQRKPVVRIDPQLDGLKLGFPESTNLFGLRELHFPKWSTGNVKGVKLTQQDNRALLAIEDAYAHRCAEIPWAYDKSPEFAAAIAGGMSRD